MEDGACLDVALHGFFGDRCEKSYVDINPDVPTNCSSPPRYIYHHHDIWRNVLMKLEFVRWSLSMAPLSSLQ